MKMSVSAFTARTLFNMEYDKYILREAEVLALINTEIENLTHKFMTSWWSRLIYCCRLRKFKDESKAYLKAEAIILNTNSINYHNDLWYQLVVDKRIIQRRLVEILDELEFIDNMITANVNFRDIMLEIDTDIF